MPIEATADSDENFNANETLEFTTKKMVPKILQTKRKQRDTKYALFLNNKHIFLLLSFSEGARQ